MNSGEINALTPAPTESKGSLVGSIIVILILIIGAIYLFSRPAAAPVAPTTNVNINATTTTPVATSTATTVATTTINASSTLEL